MAISTNSLWFNGPDNRLLNMADVGSGGQVIQASSLEPDDGWTSLDRAVDNLASESVLWTVSSASYAYITFDLGAARTANSLIFCNIYSFGFADSFRVYGHTSDLGASEAAWQAGAAFKTQDDFNFWRDWNKNHWASLGGLRNYRYWRVSMRGNDPVPVGFGELLLGVGEDTTNALQAPIPQDDEIRRVQLQTEGENEFSYLLDRAQKWEFAMSAYEQDEYLAIKQRLYNVKNGHYPMVICPDFAKQLTLYGKLDPVVPWEWRSGRQWNLGFIFRELSQGFIMS